MEQNASSGRSALILWLLQRVTALLIFVVLGLHIFKVHYADLGQPILFSQIVRRMNLIFDVSLLFLVLFHGLNGVRSVLIDLKFFSRREKAVSFVLIIIGAFFAVWGIRGLWAFNLIR